MKVHTRQHLERDIMHSSKSPQAMTTPNWPGNHDEDLRDYSPMLPNYDKNAKADESYWSFDDEVQAKTNQAHLNKKNKTLDLPQKSLFAQTPLP